MTQGIKAISTGAKKNMGKTWHLLLADKGARLRNHVYYAIDSYKGDGNQLRKLVHSAFSE